MCYAPSDVSQMQSQVPAQVDIITTCILKYNLIPSAIRRAQKSCQYIIKILKKIRRKKNKKNLPNYLGCICSISSEVVGGRQ